MLWCVNYLCIWCDLWRMDAGRRCSIARLTLERWRRRFEDLEGSVCLMVRLNGMLMI